MSPYVMNYEGIAFYAPGKLVSSSFVLPGTFLPLWLPCTPPEFFTSIHNRGTKNLSIFCQCHTVDL